MVRHFAVACLLFALKCAAQDAPAPQPNPSAQPSSPAAQSAAAAEIERQNAAASAHGAELQNQNSATSAQGAALQEQNAGTSAQGAALQQQNAGISAQGAALQRQNSGISAQGAALQEQNAAISAQGADLQQRNAGISAQGAELQERRARRAASLAKHETTHASRAVPVFEELAPPTPGLALSLQATCTDLSKRGCERLSKPVSVQVHSGGRTLTPEFNPDSLTGNSLTVNLVHDRLEAGMLVSVTYDEGKLTTPWEPVLPSELKCCDITGSGTYALALINAPVYIEAKDSKGKDKSLRVEGRLEGDSGRHKGWWKFSDATRCPANVDGPDCLAPGDTLLVVALVDGKPKPLTQMAWAAQTPSQPPPPTKSARLTRWVPAFPVAAESARPVPSTPGPVTTSVPPPPVVPVAAAPAPATNTCRAPQIANSLSAGGKSIVVQFGCVSNTPVFTFYLDNKPQSGVTWQRDPADPFVFTGTLAKALRPYQRAKVVQFDPPGSSPDAPTKLVTNSVPASAPQTGEDWWVAKLGKCPAPRIASALHAGDMSLTVVFPDAAKGLECSPDLQTKVYLDNVGFDLAWKKTANHPLTYVVQLAAPLQAYQWAKVLQKNPAQSQAHSVEQEVLSAPTMANPVAGPNPATPPDDPPPAPDPPQLQAPPPGPAPPDPVKITRMGPCADPYVQNAPGLTDSVAVILGCLPKDPNNDLLVQINGQPVAKGVTWSFTSLSPITMTAKLPSKLNDGDTIAVYQIGQRGPVSPAQVAAAPPKPPDPSFIQTVQEGATSVTGTAKGLDKVRIQVVDGKNLRQQVDASVDSTTNSFTANLTTPLQADQQLQFYGVSKSGTQSATATSMEVEPLALDWGRVRGYFTAGVVLSNNNSQFNLTNANLFLGFNVDKQWRLPARSFSETGSKFSDRFAFNTYFDARLTAIPTGTTGSTTASTSSATPTLTGGSTGSTSSSSSSSSSSATGNPSPNVTSLLSNNQAAALQVGAYLPFTVSSWDFRERYYSLFLAPIGKVGFYTVTDSGNAAFQAAENANRNSSTFFPFYSYGVRVGHRRDYTTKDGRNDADRAPEQLSYLDISVGKWSNYEFIEPYNFTTSLQPTCTMQASNPATAACDVTQRLWRYGFEGLLVIPNTPLIIGLSANVAAQHPRGPNLFYLSPPDDLRFLFGVRFDASKLTGALSKIAGQ
jgi:hypothetical protein